MSDGLLLSIIIPYYNADEWIGRMLDSLLDQDIPTNSYEIIVIDDGSTDCTGSLRYYTERYSNIVLFRQENAGPSVARNRGIDLAKGKWLYFCDSDDFVQPQLFGYLLRAAERLDLEMLVCDWRVVQPDAVPQCGTTKQVSDVCTGKDYLASFASRPMDIGFGAWRFFIKKEVLLENRIRWENLVYIEDRLFQLDLLLVVRRVAHASVQLYYYVQNESSILHFQKRKRYEQYAEYIWYYIMKLSEMIKNESLGLSSDAIIVLDGWRDMAVFSLLVNCFRYCPVSSSREYLSRLSSIEDAYPVKVIRKGLTRFARKCMGHRTLWIALCRMYHLIPLSIRLLF